MGGKKRNEIQLENNPLWYKDAIIYELHVRAFCDSVGMGSGFSRPHPEAGLPARSGRHGPLVVAVLSVPAEG